MRQLLYFSTVLFLAACGSGSIDDSANGEFPLSRLAGNWEDVNRENKFYEQWATVEDNHLIGKGFVLSESDTVFIEQLEIKPKGDDLYYVVKLSGSKAEQAVEFKMTKMSANEITFENPEHDYPKMISYRMISNMEMQVFLNGMENGTFGEDRFSFVKKEM